MLPIVFIDMKENAERARKIPTDPIIGANDPFFKAVRDQLAVMKLVPSNLDHDNGKFSTQRGNIAALSPEEKTLAAVYGILERDNMIKPEVDHFGEAVVKALSEYSSDAEVRQLFDAVLEVLVEAGQTPSANPTEKHVRTNWWAAIVRSIKGNVTHTDPHLDEIVTGVLVDLRNADTDGSSTPSAIDIDLPALEDNAEVEIIPENLHAIQAIYFAAILDQGNWRRVRSKIVELWIGGLLPLFGRGNACNMLYRIWKKSNERFSEMELGNLNARIFGFPGGDATHEMLNREYNDFSLRFISAVSSYVRQRQVDDILRSNIPLSGNQEQVRNFGRSLAGNLSLHGYGVHPIATELQTEIREMLTLFNDPEIKAAWGAHDAFQLVEQVSTLELGGAKSSTRTKILANSGAIIIRWLANNASRLVSSSLVPVLDDKVIRKRVTAKSLGKKIMLDPTDYDLVNACDQQVVARGMQDVRVEEYAQPYEPPTMTSQPIRIPSIARDMLESVGVQAGMDSGNGRYSRYARR